MPVSLEGVPELGGFFSRMKRKAGNIQKTANRMTTRAVSNVASAGMSVVRGDLTGGVTKLVGVVTPGESGIIAKKVGQGLEVVAPVVNTVGNLGLGAVTGGISTGIQAGYAGIQGGDPLTAITGVASAAAGAAGVSAPSVDTAAARQVASSVMDVKRSVNRSGLGDLLAAGSSTPTRTDPALAVATGSTSGSAKSDNTPFIIGGALVLGILLLRK